MITMLAIFLSSRVTTDKQYETPLGVMKLLGLMIAVIQDIALIKFLFLGSN